MSQDAVQVVGLYVRDQDEALAFYVDKLGFRVHTDVRNGDYRWLTVQHPEQPSFQLGLFAPGPPVHDAATAQTLRAVVAKGAMPPLVLSVGDCRAAYDRLLRQGRGVHAGAGGALRQRGRGLSRPVGQRVEDDPGWALTMVKKTPPKAAESASALIDAKIAELGDWRGQMLARLRALIQQAVPGVTEEWKWGTPVWSHHGIVCTGETYKKAVKMTFAKGASRARPVGPVQFQPRRQRAARDRLSRGRQARREGAQGADSRRCGLEPVCGPRLAAHRLQRA